MGVSSFEKPVEEISVAAEEVGAKASAVEGHVTTGELNDRVNGNITRMKHPNMPTLT